MRVLTVTLGILAALAAAPAASAEPPVGINPNAVEIELDCGGQPLTITTILHNSSAAAQVSGASSSVGILQGIDVYEGGVLVFEYRNPGFARNALELVACDFENPQFPGTSFTGYLLFTPAQP